MRYSMKYGPGDDSDWDKEEYRYEVIPGVVNKLDEEYKQFYLTLSEEVQTGKLSIDRASKMLSIFVGKQLSTPIYTKIKL